jgi:hypothetical protein
MALLFVGKFVRISQSVLDALNRANKVVPYKHFEIGLCSAEGFLVFP